jgi:predicted nucleotidyltransferase
VENPVVRTALAELHDALRTVYGDQIPALIVYGCQARGDATPESDVDVLLVYPGPVQPGREIRRVSHILSDLNLRYGVLISILPVSLADYWSQTSPFWLNVRREGVSLDAI